MSTSTYYSFIATANNTPRVVMDDSCRQALSPSSFASSSNSSSSLNHYTSSTPTPSTPSSSLTNNSITSSSNNNNNRPAISNDDVEQQRALQFNGHLQSHQLQPKRNFNINYNNSHCQPKLSTSSTFHSLESRPFRPFKSNDGYLFAMKEDLAEWLNNLYDDLELNTENFIDELDTGALLCRHANYVTSMGKNYTKTLVLEQQQQLNSNSNHQHQHLDNTLNGLQKSRAQSSPFVGSYKQQQSNVHEKFSSIETNQLSPTFSPRSQFNIDWSNVKLISYRQSAATGTFFARDNICQFINWCKSLNIMDCLLFETDDLVLRKNERSFILCLLEVARIGFKVGMSTPLIIQLEQEIDRAIENNAKFERQQQDIDNRSNDSETQDQQRQVNDETHEQQREKSREIEDEDFELKPQVITNDLVSLHERVVELLNMCTCPTQFPMVRIEDGKYRVGDKLVIFLRILRNHIMVRVGGGWDTLEHYLDKHDPCRCKLQSLINNGHNSQQRQFGSVSRLKTLQQLQQPAQSMIGQPFSNSHQKNSSNSRLGSLTNTTNLNDNCEHYQIHDSQTNNNWTNGERQTLRRTSLASSQSAIKFNNKRISSSVSMSWLPLSSPNQNNNNNKSINQQQRQHSNSDHHHHNPID